ncbi:hypothetical protein L3V77_05800 [Vibrio sp. DW001]|uniref:hypothetical protein n=1 Tax=Vibrio sp. DW001 TaxID=2912315 RepID=UPI0023B0458D|nr:hypothetical protein [Vibrio sp. DW001]WED27751.1 hypothetical protein L3V77_05800 [Vibrio sp. DW001]
MERVATRLDDWNLYKAGEQYFESQIKLTSEQLASDGEEVLTNSGNLKQLEFNQDSVKNWFNDSKTEDDFRRIMAALEPIIIELWTEKKLSSWTMEIY